MSNFVGIKKQGAGRLWDWPYPLTNVINVIRDAKRKSTRSRQILLHIMQYCTEQFKEAKILLRSSFDYSTKLYLKEEAILTNSQNFC